MMSDTASAPSSLSSLVKALEEAPCGNRALGSEVLIACGWTCRRAGDFAGPVYVWTSPDGRECQDGQQPNPTTSLDAAMTVKPKGWITSLAEESDNGYWRWELQRSCDGPFSDAYRPTAPLALCIAAIKARIKNVL